MELTTLLNVRRYLELKDADTALDSLIEEQIIAIGKAVDAYCNRVFEQNEWEEFHDGGVQRIFLKNTPVLEIIGIWVDDDWGWEDTTKLSESDYLLKNGDTGIVVCKHGYFSSSETPNEIKVLYMAGYNPGVIPEDLEMAIRTQVAYVVKRRQDIGLTSVSLPDGTIQKRDINEFLPSVEAILNRYVIMSL